MQKSIFVLLSSCLLVTWASDSAVLDVSVLELDRDGFGEELAVPKYEEGHCLIEFYANWCPHCQHYKPVYAKIGKYFNEEPRPEPLIWVARVDCAVKDNIPLCDKFKVMRYPTILMGTAEDFLDHNVDQLINIPAKQPDEVINLINRQLGTDYLYEEGTGLTKLQPDKQERQEKAIRFDVDDVERATVEIFEPLLESTVILRSSEVRQAFVNWVALLEAAHPSQRCRSSFRYLSSQMGTLWPEYADGPSPQLSKLKICGVQYQKEWGSCAGSLPNTRGFTCGLWQLLHALTLGVSEQEADLWMRGVRSFIEYFFGCAECSKHFLATMDKDDARRVESREDLIVWLWTTHNTVNRRLRREETESGTGDPAFPKIQWPPENFCPRCQVNVDSDGALDWNRGAVLEFLDHFYSAPTPVDQETFFGRRELIAGNREVAAGDVFLREDAVAMERLASNGSVDITKFVLVAMVIAVILVVRRSRRRKLVSTSKDIL